MRTKLDIYFLTITGSISTLVDYYSPNGSVRPVVYSLLDIIMLEIYSS